MSEALEQFQSSLSTLGETWSTTTGDAFHGTVIDAIREPAVGAPLPFGDLDMPAEVTRHPTPDELLDATTGVTAAGLAIAEYGSVVLQSRPGGDEPVSLYPERHVVVVRASDLVVDIPSAVSWLSQEFAAGRDSAILASGASATGDMGAIVEGVHGPLEVHVIIVTDR